MVALEKLRRVPEHLTVWTVIFTADIVKITVDTVKCTETHYELSKCRFFWVIIYCCRRIHCKKCYEVYNMFTIQCCMKIKKWV